MSTITPTTGTTVPAAGATSSATSATASAAAAGTTTAADQEDRFMKLLVAQMKNQDPLNPMDNAQMTSQIAQINTVGGIEKLNTTVSSLLTAFNGMQKGAVGAVAARSQRAGRWHTAVAGQGRRHRRGAARGRCRQRERRHPRRGRPGDEDRGPGQVERRACAASPGTAPMPTATPWPTGSWRMRVTVATANGQPVTAVEATALTSARVAGGLPPLDGNTPELDLGAEGTRPLSAVQSFL